jgi:hypothetical protein
MEPFMSIPNSGGAPTLASHESRVTDHGSRFTSHASKPWHRQLWPWLLIAPPAASIVGGVALLWIAIASNDGLVTPASTSHPRILSPAEAANCAVKDRACLNAPVGEAR